jgi:hypothetical protein
MDPANRETSLRMLVLPQVYAENIFGLAQRVPFLALRTPIGSLGRDRGKIVF